MYKTFSLTLILVPLWPGVVITFGFFALVKYNYLIIYVTWNHLTMCKQMIDIKLNNWYLIAMLESIQLFGLVTLFNGISTLFRLFNAKAILLEEQLWYYLTHSWEDKGVHTFPKGICPKVNVIARLEYELAYYDSAVHRFNHCTTRTPLHSTVSKWMNNVDKNYQCWIAILENI